MKNCAFNIYGLLAGQWGPTPCCRMLASSIFITIFTTSSEGTGSKYSKKISALIYARPKFQFRTRVEILVYKLRKYIYLTYPVIVGDNR